MSSLYSSDIFIAFKKALHDTIPSEITHDLFLYNSYAKVLTHEDGTAYLMKSIEWDRKDNPEINNLYVWLTLHADFMDYQIIVVRNNEPESRYGDSGGWLNNPWKAKKVIKAVLEVDGE